jgi:hypothetical protein
MDKNSPVYRTCGTPFIGVQESRKGIFVYWSASFQAKRPIYFLDARSFLLASNNGIKKIQFSFEAYFQNLSGALIMGKPHKGT